MNNKGFTLIEMIGVMIIIAIITSVLTIKYLNTSDMAKAATAQNAIAEIKGRLSAAQSKYYMNKGIMPSNQELYDYAISNEVYGSAGNLSDVGSDFTITVVPGNPIKVVAVISTTNVSSNFIGAK